jgi:hypothetical protein
VANSATRRAGFANLSLAVLLVLWVALFAWRKTFAYVSVGGLYAIEIAVMLSLWLFVQAVLVQPRLSFTVPRNAGIRRAMWVAAAFVVYNVARASLSAAVNPKGLIPGVYPAYFIITLVIAANTSEAMLRFVARALVWMFFLAPLVVYLNRYLIIPTFGAIEDPGATYVYSIAMVFALVLIENRLLSFALFGLYFAFSVLMFERATFANAALAAVMLFLASRRREKGELTRLFLGRSALYLALLILLAPLALGLLFNLAHARFTVTSGNLVKFFEAIFSTNTGLGLSGTREHRLDMWAQLLRLAFHSPGTVLFGYGYEGEVGDWLGITFRAPHNGFMTILFRGGIVGLGLYAWFLHALYGVLRGTMRSLQTGTEARRQAGVGLVILGALIGDTLTGTILDSPFTSWLFYAQTAIVCVSISRGRAAEPDPGAAPVTAGYVAAGGAS